MALGRKTGGRNFEKGHVPASPGRPRLAPDILESRKLSFEEMLRTVIKIRALTADEIKAIDMKTITLGEAVILRAYKTADARLIQYYESRIWGEVTKQIEISSTGEKKILVEIVDATKNTDPADAVASESIPETEKV